VCAVHTLMAFIQYQINCLVKTFQRTLKNHFVHVNTHSLKIITITMQPS
jgi:hypothetical protein